MNPWSSPSDSRPTAHRLCLARRTRQFDCGRGELVGLWESNSKVMKRDGPQIVSGSYSNTIRLWNTETALGAKANASDQDDTEFVYSDLRGTPLRLVVPGFNQCSLSLDGWVHSSSKRLFWVPPDNRRGLKYPYRLTIPTSAPFRVTKLDFTNFQSGSSWTKVRTDACS
ncbi:hypothetical protein PIIN_10998 [Serendipita indica DSM 11827]|uniref:Uncharacterized protein n=1 Tax=Serendipita indica (strain DSM 11827) TaxID=1109443 RepID=G4U0C0_SERID|nr:hypothetical protein PIIN_10998 [Serendipita indica DSM 11827]